MAQQRKELLTRSSREVSETPSLGIRAASGLGLDFSLDADDLARANL